MRLERALTEYFVGGIKTNIPLFQRILQDPDFHAARLDTGYLERLMGGPSDPQAPAQGAQVAAAIAAALFAAMEGTTTEAEAAPVNSAHWKRAALRDGLR